MEVREIRSGELAAAAACTLAAYRSLPGLQLSDEYLGELGDVARRASSALVLVAVDAGVVVGAVTDVGRPGPYAEFDDPDEAGIRHLAVSPDARQRGAGSALVTACVERARHDGKTRLSLLTTPHMTAAHRIYERLGFCRAPERDRLPEPDFPLLAYVLEFQAGGHTSAAMGTEGFEPSLGAV